MDFSSFVNPLNRGQLNALIRAVEIRQIELYEQHITSLLSAASNGIESVVVHSCGLYDGINRHKGSSDNLVQILDLKFNVDGQNIYITLRFSRWLNRDDNVPSGFSSSIWSDDVPENGFIQGNWFVYPRNSTITIMINNIRLRFWDDTRSVAKCILAIANCSDELNFVSE